MKKKYQSKFRNKKEDKFKRYSVDMYNFMNVQDYKIRHDSLILYYLYWSALASAQPRPQI